MYLVFAALNDSAGAYLNLAIGGTNQKEYLRTFLGKKKRGFLFVVFGRKRHQNDVAIVYSTLRPTALVNVQRIIGNR